jgi:hypothetical protein
LIEKVVGLSAFGSGKLPRRSASLATLFALALVAVAPLLSVAPGATAAGMGRAVQAQVNVQSTFNDSKFTATDIDGDGIDEILAGNTNGYMYCFTPNGGTKWAFYTGAAIRGGAACYDVDGCGKKEVFFGDMNGVVWGLGCNGVSLSQWGWPKQTPNTGGYVGVYGAPAIGDINGDGAPDIVVGCYGHYVYAWSFSGGNLPGYPIDTKDTIWSSPALADINRDGSRKSSSVATARAAAAGRIPPAASSGCSTEEEASCPASPSAPRRSSGRPRPVRTSTTTDSTR